MLASMAATALSRKLKPIEVAVALAQLKHEGEIVSAFAVRVPSGPVLNRVYHSINEIEPTVYDSFNRQIPRDELEVLPAFERVLK